MTGSTPDSPRTARPRVMARTDQVPTVLSYAPPRPKASRAALLGDIGCLSSLVGAFLVGAIVPWAVLRYDFVYDGAPSLVGGALLVVFGVLIGAILGALVVPAIVLSAYWIIWRLVGRP